MDVYKELSDNELQSRFQKGDPAAQEALIKRYLIKVRICARKYYLLGGDNDDLIQEGTIGLLSAIRNFDPSANVSFNTYAEHCINMRLIDAIKHKVYMPFISSEDVSIPADSIYVLDPEEQFIQDEQYQELLSDFSKILSKFENKVFELFIAGSSYSEIADSLGKPMTSVYNAVQRIRQKLSAGYKQGNSSIS